MIPLLKESSAQKSHRTKIDIRPMFYPCPIQLSRNRLQYKLNVTIFEVTTTIKEYYFSFFLIILLFIITNRYSFHYLVRKNKTAKSKPIKSIAVYLNCSLIVCRRWQKIQLVQSNYSLAMFSVFT